MPPDQLNEQEIQFKKRARRRLVGAVALVLLMITILPMVLDDKANKTPQQEIAITIPSQDGEFTSKVVPVVPDAAPAAQPSEIPEDTQQNVPAEAAPSKDIPKPIELPPAAGPSAEAKPSEPIIIPTEQAKKEVQKPEPPAKAPVEKNPAAKNNALFVQIGVFSDPANVKQLQQKLQAQGFKSQTEKLPTATGDKIRLRIGPFASRDDAESALDKVKESGLSGMVVSNK
ncbi:MAG TPA: SPOR domain-containing protein [Methylophilaceae bacterium]|nr:SPOR domain-containing protein [Methylophilaceae bacterium]